MYGAEKLRRVSIETFDIELEHDVLGVSLLELLVDRYSGTVCEFCNRIFWELPTTVTAHS